MRRAALDDRIGADVFRHGAEQAEEIDAEMVEEAAVLGGQHRLDDMVRHLVDRHGIALDDAALADLVAVAVEEGDGEIALVAPVLAVSSKAGMASASMTTEPAAPMVAPSLSSSKIALRQPVTRKRRKKMVRFSQISPALKPAS